jgi:hypothetical protein
MDAASLTSHRYGLMLTMLETYFSSVIKNTFIDIQDTDQMVSLMAKIEIDGDDMWVKDGLVFTNAQQDYNEGVNPLCLQWKDNLNSFFHMKKSKQGSLIVNLTLTETSEFETADEIAVPQTQTC